MSRKPPPDPDRLWALYHASLLDRGCRPATIGGYQRVLSMWFRHLARQRPPVPWAQATTDHFRAWLDAKPDAWSAKRRRGPQLSDGSRWHYTKTVKQLYAWAFDEDIIPADPLRRLARPRRPDPLPRALDLDDVARLLDHVELGDERVKIAAWLAYGCGLRVGEIAALRVEDVRLRGQRPSLLAHGKGGKDRVVPLAQPVREVLAGWLAGPPRRTSGPLLPSSKRAEGLQAQTITSMLANAMKAAAVPESGHGLRHTYATRLLEAGKGTNLRAVSRLLGHSSTVTTERVYTSSFDLDAYETAALLPDPRTKCPTPADTSGPGSVPQALGTEDPEVAAWTAQLERADPGLLDQIAACAAELEAHADAVAKAMAAAGVLTTRFCSSFAKVHPDPMSMRVDQDREQVVDAIGVMSMWAACDRIARAHPDS